MSSFERPPQSFAEDQESQEEPVKYLYHMVPANLVGDTLYPLNELKETHPDLYQTAAAKYDGREQLMAERIPIGDEEVLWNDVLHLTAIPPQEVKKALAEAGTDLPTWEWYQIPISLIKPDQSVIWSGRAYDQQEYKPLDEEGLKMTTKLPEETKAYYREEIAAGGRPLLFKDAPHIFYKGSIFLKECTKITV